MSYSALSDHGWNVGGLMQKKEYLLGSLLLLSISFLLLLHRSLLNWRRFLSLGFFLDGHKETDDILGLDHVVLIDLKLAEDVINLSLGHLVSPGGESVLEHLGVNVAFII